MIFFIMDIFKIEKISIQASASIIQTLKKMDAVAHKMLLVLEGESFKSIITVGDIQRAIIANVDLASPIGKIVDNSTKEFAKDSDNIEFIKHQILSMRAEFMPVLNAAGELVKVYDWGDFYPTESIIGEREKIDLPVVIMAGGKGSRLKPLTNVIPKPLIPVGDKTILEEIMEQFEFIGCKKFFISVSYKYDMMEFYLNQLDKHYDIEFFMEDKPLGTIGSVALLKDKISKPFFVSNCDIRIDQDFRDVYDYHKENNNDITIVTAVKSYRIPYGVIETGESGLMKGITEKPELSFMINTGVYLLNPELITEIPEGKFFHITNLMEKVRVRGGRVGCFPVSDGQWQDMGEWPEYLKMINV